MFADITTLYEALQQTDTADPFTETLHLVDLLAGGALRQPLLAKHGLSLPELLAGHQAGHPWEYILGWTTFMGLTFHCRPGALIPRAETELLAQTVLADLRALPADAEPLVIDIGTGSGNIAVALAVHVPRSRILASDISAEAVALAREHVALHGVNGRVTLFTGDLFEPLRGQGYEDQTDVIVCNPPYIPTGSLDNLPPTARAHEPVEAFDAGPYGINIFRRLVKDACTFLKPAGLLAFEIGAGQEKIARRLLHKAGGYTHIQPHKDSSGIVRVMTARKTTS